MKASTLISAIVMSGLVFGTHAALAQQGTGPNAETNYNVSRGQAGERPTVGGYRYDFEYEPFIRRNGPYGNYPDFDPRSFSEQVFSDPRQSSLGASGL